MENNPGSNKEGWWQGPGAWVDWDQQQPWRGEERRDTTCSKLKEDYSSPNIGIGGVILQSQPHRNNYCLYLARVNFTAFAAFHCQFCVIVICVAQSW